ncbi:MAG: hypothetical protein JWM36_1174 [Hyphomicrobiales bacterium]|nr:hypothetical protein [Hyphomicrobiales bacterium]
MNVTTFDSGEKMIAPPGTGALDAATSSDNAALYKAVARKIDIKIVASSGSARRAMVTTSDRSQGVD